VSAGFNYGGKRSDGQHERHPSLPAEKRTAFVRPVRDSYRHVGCRPSGTTRELTDQERVDFASEGYVAFEAYGPERAPVLGRYWTPKQLASGCGTVTTMGRALAETYAAQPTFYGRTFCTRCGDYFDVGVKGEFVWIEHDGTDGPRVGT
jgi:hypothetical protein